MCSEKLSSKKELNLSYNMKVILSILSLLFIVLQGCAGKSPLTDYNTDGTANHALIYQPKGTGPFPAVIFNHGMVVDKFGLFGATSKGYELSRICGTLSDDGYFVFAPIRQSGMGNIPGHKQEVNSAINYVKILPQVDPSRIGLMGFSRGGLLTLMVAVERSDLKALVILAPAPGRGDFAKAVRQVSSINAPVMLLVEKDDGQNILENFDMLSQALEEHGKARQIIKYNRGGGHRLFWDVGYYWDDVRSFLIDNL